MAVITPYTENVTAQGQINSQATSASFGGQVGEALTNFGAVLQKQETEDDVTNVHVEMSRVRAQWDKNLEEMANSTKPGDTTLMPRVMDGISQQFDSMSEIPRTRQGQQLFARMSADMTTVVGVQARALQANLNGEYAKNQYTELTTNLGGSALKNYSEWENLVAQGTAAIDDPNGRFASLPGPAREAFRKNIEETIMFNAARGFARQNPGAVLGTVDPKLAGAVTNAVNGPSAQPPAPGMPPNLNASIVKPYNQNQISSNVKAIDTPSKYDQYFTDAAQLYKLDPRELKMRAVVESGLDPKAVSGQRAQGIMQFTPEMAKSLNINPHDPESSIHAAAKLLAGYRDKAGGDMSKVDLMYYGGEGGKSWGSNTYQYAANMSALRTAAGLGAAVDPSKFQVAPAVRVSEAANGVQPKTGISFIDKLPPEKMFSILTEAEHYKNAYESQSARNRVEQEHQEKKAQDITMKGFYSRIINPNGNPLTEMEIIQNNTLTMTQQQHLIDVARRRTNEVASDGATRPHPEKVREILLNIHAADGDPSKMYSDQPVWDAYKAGELNANELEFLNARVNGLKDPSGNAFMKQVKTIEDHVWRGIQGNPQIQGKEMTSPGISAAIAFQFSQDLQAKIADMRKNNKDPRILLDAGSPEYVMKPGFLQPYIPMAGGASPAAAPAAAAAKLPTYKEYDKLSKGAKYTDPQGNMRVKG